MAHLIESQGPPPGPSPGPNSARRFDAPRLGFWAALAAAAGAAGIALTAGPAVGLVGAALFVGVAGVSLGFFVWTRRAQGLALFPSRGGAGGLAGDLAGHPLGLVLALDEPALLADRSGAALSANEAYLELVRRAGVGAESSRPPPLDRLFGGDPLLSAPMYRLSRAAGLGQRRREELPPAILGEGGAQRFEASVAPVGDGRVLWRLRSMGPQTRDADAAPAAGLFIEDAPFGFFAARPDGTVAYLNPALRTVIGCGAQDGPATLGEFLHDDLARILRRDRRGAMTRGRVTLTGRDGAETPAALVVVWPSGEDDGLCRGYLFFGGLQEVAEAPASARVRVREPNEAFFAYSPFGAALLDGADPASATILDANPALMDIAQGRAAPGAAFVDLFEAAEGPAALADRLRKAASGAPVDLSMATDPPTAAHVHFVRMGDGRGVAYVINVTEQRELEQRLAQSEKMREIGLLAGGVAHDFNNLLTVMMQTTDYLLLRHPVGDPDYKDLQLINTHSLRAKELTEMLRAYARQQTFKTEIMEVAGFMQQMHELGRRLCGDTIKAEIEHSANLPYVKADRTQLERVIVNLMTNARDAMTPKDWGMPRGGVLSLKTTYVTAGDIRPFAGHVTIEEGGYVQISVGDTGGGIKPEDQPKIFLPFHSTKEPNKGTGLGLATCYGIIKQSGGYIFFDSRPGKGTTFRVYLPAYEPQPGELEEIARRDRERLQRKPMDVSGRGRILFVEDDDDVRATTARNLEALGFEIVCAEEGEDGLRILKENPRSFHIIVSDVSMPLLNGPEMVKAAGPELLGEAKVLFMSGFAQEHIARMIADIPNSHHLSKPVGAAELARRIKQLMAA
jgi:two-component system cell cycle sensor histidine kinase/response regulator CckA